MISIINYGSGNLKSIHNGLIKVGADPLITSDPDKLSKSKVLILPGVGAFGTAMYNLTEYEDIIKDHINQGKPFLGVCLGLHLLLSNSAESSGIQGLNIFQGDVNKLPPGNKIPHMGWNQINLKNGCPILKNIENEYFYFVHSYYIRPKDENIIAATASYGVDIPSVLFKGNVFATQFHPEKSGENGLRLLKNFLNLIK